MHTHTSSLIAVRPLLLDASPSLTSDSRTAQRSYSDKRRMLRGKEGNHSSVQELFIDEEEGR